LLVGPPGAGKSMLANRFGSLLPAMKSDEARESAAIRSLAGGFHPDAWGPIAPPAGSNTLQARLRWLAAGRRQG
jgi:predicted ATPase with chaperone activity